jgi:hypothetical protein
MTRSQNNEAGNPALSRISERDSNDWRFPLSRVPLGGACLWCSRSALLSQSLSCPGSCQKTLQTANESTRLAWRARFLTVWPQASARTSSAKTRLRRVLQFERSLRFAPIACAPKKTRVFEGCWLGVHLRGRRRRRHAGSLIYLDDHEFDLAGCARGHRGAARNG